MWYCTTFDGSLKINDNISDEALEKLEGFMWEDMRDHDEWDTWNMTWIDLEINKNDLTIEWDWAEKTYDLVEKVNFIIQEMLKDFPDFCLHGTLYAQWEESDDMWKLIVIDNVAKWIPVIQEWDTITCPHCKEKFTLE